MKPCNCNKARVGRYTSEQCYLCWLGFNRRDYAELWNLTQPQQHQSIPSSDWTFGDTFPCIHRNSATGKRVTCLEGCRTGVSLPVLECELYRECTVSRKGAEIAKCCRDCSSRAEYVRKRGVLPYTSSSRLTYDSHFNPSLVRLNGRTFLATRHPHGIFFGELNGKLDRLELGFERCEDPRLFLVANEIWISFAVVDGNRVHQAVGKLGNKPDIVEYGEQSVEKNWTFFHLDNDIYFEYSISPHVVVRLKDFKEYTTINLHPWSGGYLRGGAPPQLTEQGFVSFFHGCDEGKPVEGRSGRQYNIGAYLFELKPPFSILGQTADPLVWADPVSKPPHIPPSCIFPSGAVLSDDEWIVACGVHDSWIELLRWSHADVIRLVLDREGSRNVKPN